MNITHLAKPYLDRRMLRIFLLGIMSGFPWVLIGSALSLWLKENELSRSTIGWAGLIFGVYAINFLWAPLIDRIHIPFLSKKIGHRKSWIILMQSFIFISLLSWSFLNPTENLWLIIAVGLAIAISSATQDITIDALRIEQINENEKNLLAAGAAFSVVGWWTGYKIGGLISLVSADILQKKGFENYWQISFLILCLIILSCSLLLLLIPEKSSDEKIENQKKSEALNLNQKIYKRFFEFQDFQFVFLYDQEQTFAINELKNELVSGVGTDLMKWNFIPTNRLVIKEVFESFNTNLKLDEEFGTPYVFIIDRNLNLRGRDDDEDSGILYGFNSQSVAEINNKMVDDVKIILAEYRLALKKNDSLFK